MAKKSLIVLALLAVVVVITAVITTKVVLGHERIVQGVFAGPIELSDLSKDEAAKALQGLEKELWARTTAIEVYSNKWDVNLKDLGIKVDVHEMVENAYNIGRNGAVWQQYQTRKDIAKQGREVQLEILVDRKVMEAKLNELTKQILNKPVNASLQITPADQIVIIPGKNGVGIDTTGVAEELEKLIEEKTEHLKVVLKVKEAEPQQTAADIEAMRIKALVAQYTTRFDASQGNRSYNIVVAAGALNGLLVKPGETVSFNEIVGPRSSEAGYREAPVIVNNKLVPGIGGGVCQVSTTLYNSLLKGNFSIVSRRPHSFPSSYVPVGRDATVTYGGIDFKFKNNRTSYMYIKSEVSGNRLTFKLFADPAENKEIEIIDRIELVIPNKTVYENDPNLPKGKQLVKEKGHKGYRTTTVRLVKQNGVVVNREVVTKSYYKPINRIIAVGAGAAVWSSNVTPQAAPIQPASDNQNASTPQPPNNNGQTNTTQPSNTTQPTDTTQPTGSNQEPVPTLPDMTEPSIEY